MLDGLDQFWLGSFPFEQAYFDTLPPRSLMSMAHFDQVDQLQGFPCPQDGLVFDHPESWSNLKGSSCRG